MEEIEKDIKKVYQELAPCDIVMADIEATTPDNRVKELIKLCRSLETNK